MKKRILSVFTATLIMVTMLVTAIPANAWVQWTSPSQVKGSDYTDNPAFAKALDDLFAGDIDLYKDSKRTKEVSMPLGFRVSMSNPYYMYSTSRKTQTYGWTCFIYSNGAFNKLFGEYVHRGDALKNCYIAVGKGAKTMTYDLLKNNNIRAGAYIRTSPKSDGSYYGNDGHSMIILAYDENYITYLEGNGDGKGLVRITKRTYSEFNSAQLTGRGRRVTHIVQPTEKWFNELYGNRPEDNTYSFSYDANGGKGNADSFTVDFGSEFSLSSSNFDRDACVLAGWNIKRNSDNKWYTKDGWSAENPTTFGNGEVINFDDSFITDTAGDISYTAYAVWENSVYETCTGVSLISAGTNRDSFPIGSTVSLKNSEIEFTFASGETLRVTVNGDCGSATPQTFRLNGYNYNFYIDSAIEQKGENPCYVRLDSFKGELLSLKGEKTVNSADIISEPTSIAGENATIKITYTDGTSEEIIATEFVPSSCDQDSVNGIMWTDSGFAINWNFTVNTEEDGITVTYPCGLSKTTLAGDINLDGKINTSDLASLKLILVKGTDNFYSIYCPADIDCDGQITSSDLAAIKLNLAGV